MHLPAYLLIPAAAAFIYTVASLLFKRAYEEGAGTLTVFHWSNLVSMPVFLPLFFSNHGAFPASDWWRPGVVAALMYIGTWIMFAAIRRGDISMVTPILGTKVVLVALTLVAISGSGPGSGLWLAACLATAGIFIIGKGDLKPGKANGGALLMCLGSSLLYSVSDVLIAHWAGNHGGTAFLAALPQFFGLFSLLSLIGSKPGSMRLPPGTPRWVISGSVLLALQGMSMGISLAFFNDPTGVNILYSTRGLWAIALVWCAGSWFANRERSRAGRSTMLWRLTGTVFITAGVVIAVIARSS
ncbi:MAG TPA: DMT family transporter [Verrucomicrobiales bacterium]|jgi:drug/metabolite transporter (DMT)-like permease|nr:DMT family transporter [Verrucomicrobiales bacterium]